MKNQLFQFFWLGLFLLSGNAVLSQDNVAINNTGAPPDSSAMLDVQSTTKGMLVPRMSSAQREMIDNPAEGLLVYDSDTETFWFRQGGQWAELVSGKSGLRDADGDTRVVVEETPDDDVIRFYTGDRNVGYLSWSDSLETNLGFDAGTNASSSAGTHVGYRAGYLDNGINNTILGASAGEDTLSGYNNTFIGTYSGSNTKSGYNNSFTGAHSGALNIEGYNNAFVGAFSGNFNISGFRNSFFGAGAGASNRGGIQNTFIGTAAGYYQEEGENNTYIGGAAGQGTVVDSNGIRNTAIGAFAGFKIGTGERNTMIGSYSGTNLTSGIQNTFLGASSGNATTSGERNIFLGDGSGFYNTVGSWNTFVGEDSGVDNIDGNFNVALGHTALYNNTSRSHLVAVGDSALYNNGIGATLSYHATNNSALGTRSLFSNTIGYENTGVGKKSLYHNTTGTYNTAVGSDCLSYNTTGSNNTATGFQTLGVNSSGSNNSAYGFYAMIYNSTGHENAAFGKEALYFNQGGFSNTAIGAETLFNNSGGDYNTALGFQALSGNTTGNMNTALGYNADVAASNLSNATAIGANALASQSNSLVLGYGANVSIGNNTPNQLLSVGDDFGSYLTGNRITIGNDTGISGLNIGEDIDNRAFVLWDNSNNYFEVGTRSGSTTYSSTLIIKNGKAGINNSSPSYDLHVGDGTLTALNGSDTRMVVSDNDNEDRAAMLGLARTSAGARVEAQLEANGSNTAGPSVIVGAASSHPLYIRTGNITRMTVTSSGDVGIGTSSPSTKLHVVGDVTATCGVLTCSDARYKKDVTPLRNVLTDLSELKGVYYYWNREHFPEKGFNEDRQIGIIAQTLEVNFPELVHTDNDGYKTVDYAKFSAVLLQGINEQQAEIDRLQKALTDQQKVIDKRLSDIEEKLGLSSEDAIVSIPANR